MTGHQLRKALDGLTNGELNAEIRVETDDVGCFGVSRLRYRTQVDETELSPPRTYQVIELELESLP